jgi:hypothetical protein
VIYPTQCKAVSSDTTSRTPKVRVPGNDQIQCQELVPCFRRLGRSLKSIAMRATMTIGLSVKVDCGSDRMPRYTLELLKWRNYDSTRSTRVGELQRTCLWAGVEYLWSVHARRAPSLRLIRIGATALRRRTGCIRSFVLQCGLELSLCIVVSVP